MKNDIIKEKTNTLHGFVNNGSVSKSNYID